MPQLRIDVSDVRRLGRDFDRTNRDLAKTLARAMHTSLKELSKIVRRAGYPPERPGQRYVRTLRLGKSWTEGSEGNIFEVEATAFGATGTFGSEITDKRGRGYAAYVIGPVAGEKGERQAWMHSGRWWTLEAKAEGHLERVAEIFRDAIQKLLDKLR